MKGFPKQSKGIGVKSPEAYILDLIERMCFNEAPCSSDQSIRWKAHREAESLTEDRYIQLLMQYIIEEKRKEYCGSAYFILGKLLMKCIDPVAIQFFINRLLVETDENILNSMLDRLSDIEKDQSIDISPIVQCTQSDKWRIRHAAISALAKTEHEIAKEKIRAFVQLKDQKKHKYEIIYATTFTS